MPGLLMSRRSTLGLFFMADERGMVIAAAVNDRMVLKNCLLRSPDIGAGLLQLTVLESYKSASIAYNEVLRALPSGTIVIFAHQDVYLPAGYCARLRAQIEALERSDPDWAVLGLSTKIADGGFAGKVWSTAWNDVHQSGIDLPARIVTADELLLIMKAGDGLLFDEDLPGFHLFGTDIVQTAREAGRSSYAINAPVIHHDKPVTKLDRSYRKAWRYMRKKWWNRLPIHNLIAPITRSALTLYEYDLRVRYSRRWARKRVVPTSDPSQIARRLGWE